MVDAIVGSVIMVVAATSLLYAMEVAERAIDQSGRQPLIQEEIDLLRSSELDLTDSEFDRLKSFVQSAPQEVDR